VVVFDDIVHMRMESMVVDIMEHLLMMMMMVVVVLQVEKEMNKYYLFTSSLSFKFK
jgi:hypothetical protein